MLNLSQTQASETWLEGIASRVWDNFHGYWRAVWCVVVDGVCHWIEDIQGQVDTVVHLCALAHDVSCTWNTCPCFFLYLLASLILKASFGCHVLQDASVIPSLEHPPDHDLLSVLVVINPTAIIIEWQ